LTCSVPDPTTLVALDTLPFVICFSGVLVLVVVPGYFLVPTGVWDITAFEAVAGKELDRLTTALLAVEGSAFCPGGPWYVCPLIFSPYAEAERSIS
jgi:hypothetical protein